MILYARDISLFLRSVFVVYGCDLSRADIQTIGSLECMRALLDHSRRMSKSVALKVRFGRIRTVLTCTTKTRVDSTALTSKISIQVEGAL